MTEIVKYRFKDLEEYRDALNNAPIGNSISSRDVGMGRKVEYVPIQYLQASADALFREWNVIEETYQVIANEILATVKIQYLPDYPGADYQFCTGTGAKPIQQEKGSLASKFPEGKKTNALEYNAPAARIEAVGNALNTLGNFFGRNLNRNVDNNYHMKKKSDDGTTKNA